MKVIIALSVFVTYVSCIELQRIPILLKEEISTPSPPPKPYAFGYAAGRFPGHIDRTHSEVSDGSGVVQGSYSYVDPRHKIHTVEYVADKNGFHPIINGGAEAALPSDTVAVAKAKQHHFNQYARIANSHQAAAHQPGFVVVPVDSAAVQHAKNRHFSLFEKIAAEHARIAAEREAEHAAYGATAETNHLEIH